MSLTITWRKSWVGIVESNIALRMAAIGWAPESPRRGCQTEPSEFYKANSHLVESVTNRQHLRSRQILFYVLYWSIVNSKFDEFFLFSELANVPVLRLRFVVDIIGYTYYIIVQIKWRCVVIVVTLGTQSGGDFVISLKTLLASK